MRQEEHHSKQAFRKEYVDLLNRFNVSFEEKYLFEFYDRVSDSP
jgi:putative transposase